MTTATLAIAKLLLLVNMFMPGAIPQGFIYSGTTLPLTFTYLGDSVGGSMITVNQTVPIGSVVVVIATNESTILAFTDSQSNTYPTSLFAGTGTGDGISSSFSKLTTALVSGVDTINTSASVNCSVAYLITPPSGNSFASSPGDVTAVYTNNGGSYSVGPTSNTIAAGVAFVGTVSGGSALGTPSMGVTQLSDGCLNVNRDGRYAGFGYVSTTISEAITVSFGSGGNSYGGLVLQALKY